MHTLDLCSCLKKHTIVFCAFNWQYFLLIHKCGTPATDTAPLAGLLWNCWTLIACPALYGGCASVSSLKHCLSFSSASMTAHASVSLAPLVATNKMCTSKLWGNLMKRCLEGSPSDPVLSSSSWNLFERLLKPLSPFTSQWIVRMTLKISLFRIGKKKTYTVAL